MPSTTSSSVSAVLASSMVMTPSLPTFFIALAIISPIDLSPLAAIVPTWAISSEDCTFLARRSMSLTTAVTAMSMPRFRSIGFMPGGDELEALAHDRRGQDRRGRRAVAGEIIGLRGDFAHHLRAHVLEFVGELDFLGDGDAVLGDARRAVGLVENDVAALGAERHLDGVVENFDAAQHALACVGGKSYVFGGHGFRSNR